MLIWGKAVRVPKGAGHASSVLCVSGESAMIMEIELQSQVLDAMNYVLYDQLKFKGNRMDYYNALNLYMHQVGTGAVKTIQSACRRSMSSNNCTSRTMKKNP